MKNPFRMMGKAEVAAITAAATCLALRLEAGAVHAALVRMPPASDESGVLDVARAHVLWLDREKIEFTAARIHDEAFDVVVDEPKALSAALTRLFERRGVAANTRCVWLLSSKQYQVETIDAPQDIPPEEWPDACNWIVRDQGRCQWDDSKLALLSLPVGASYSVQPKLLAFEASSQTIEAIKQIFAGLGRDLHAIDVPESAQRNLSLLTSRAMATQAVVRLGRNHLSLLVTWQGQTLWVRRIEFQAATLDRASGDRDESVIELFAQELRRTLDAFERTHSQVTLARVALVPFRDAEDVAKKLTSKLSQPVVVLDLADKLTLDEGVQPDGLSDYLQVIGATLRGCRLQRARTVAIAGEGGQDDLPLTLSFIAPEAYSARRTRSTQLSPMQAAAIASITLPLIAAAGLQIYASQIQRSVKADQQMAQSGMRAALLALTQSEQSETTAIGQQMATTAEGLPELQMLQRHLAQAGPSRLDAPYQMLLGLANAKVPGLWITSLDVDLRSSAVSMQGRTLAPHLLPQYLQSPAVRAVFNDQPFDDMRLQAEPNGQALEWRISRGKPANAAIDALGLVEAQANIAAAAASAAHAMSAAAAPAAQQPAATGAAAVLAPAPGAVLPAPQQPSAALPTHSAAAAAPSRSAMPATAPSGTRIELRVHPTDPQPVASQPRATEPAASAAVPPPAKETGS